MLKNLTYKQKLKGLGIVAFLLVFLVYFLAIRPTLGEYSKSSDLVAAAPGENGVGASAGSTLQQLREREEQATFYYTRYTLDTLGPEKNLLSIASNFCKTGDLQLKEYKPINLSTSDSAQVLTRIVTVQGGFISCLKFLHELETVKNAGRVSAAEFRSYTDPQDKKLRLDCTIYVQNLIPY